MTALSTAAGVAMVLVAARDIFDTLFHPEGKAHLGRLVTRAVWIAMRRLLGGHPRALALAGPLGMILVISTWALLLVVGWALVFLPHVDGGFRVPPGAEGGDFVDALNVSLVTLTTLGFGDVTPEAAWLRIVTPLEALVGFGLLSASVSWLLLVYPVLSRRRSLAYEVSLLRREEEDTGVSLLDLDPEAAERVMAELTSRLIAVERDLVNFPVSYYFVEADPRFSLAATAPTWSISPSGARVSAFPTASSSARSCSRRHSGTWLPPAGASTGRGRTPPASCSRPTRATTCARAEPADTAADYGTGPGLRPDGRVAGRSYCGRDEQREPDSHRPARPRAAFGCGRKRS